MPKRILIIDDEQDLVSSLAARLEAFDEATVATACDPELGVRKAKAWQPDVILLDVYMPKLDGWQAAKLLREDPETKDIPIVIMTAVLSKALMDQVRAVKADRVITKPFEDRDLESLMKWVNSGSASHSHPH